MVAQRGLNFHLYRHPLDSRAERVTVHVRIGGVPIFSIPATLDANESEEEDIIIIAAVVRKAMRHHGLLTDDNELTYPN